MKIPSVNTYEGPQSMSGTEYLKLDMLVKEVEVRKRQSWKGISQGRERGRKRKGRSILASD